MKTKQLKYLIYSLITLTSLIFGPIDAEGGSKNEPDQKIEVKSVFGNLPARIGAGVGLFTLYDFSQLSKSDEQWPRLIGVQGYGQFGKYLRFGGFATFGINTTAANTIPLTSVYGGPLVQFTLFLDPFVIALGSKFGMGMNFSQPARIDFMIYPHLDLELRLFENLSISAGIGFLKTRFSNTWPKLDQFNINFGITFLNFSTERDPKGNTLFPPLPPLPKLSEH